MFFTPSAAVSRRQAPHYSTAVNSDYRLEFWWANAGVEGGINATAPAQIEIFVDSDNDYSNGGRIYSRLTEVQPFDGFGSQTWHGLSVYVELEAGEYWLGFAQALDDTYVVIDNVSLEFVGEILIGDVNQDESVDLLDVAPFVSLLTTGSFQVEADINQDGVVDLLDVAPFVDLLTGG